MDSARRAKLETKARKIGARAAMHAAIRFGLIQKGPCEVCGEKEVDGHHNGYDDPFDVRWLCKQHHIERHGGRLWLHKNTRNLVHSRLKTLCGQFIRENAPAVYEELKKLTVIRYPA